MELPARDDAAEDAFVAAWLERDDPDGLVEVVIEAIEARRPRLAGRLFQLLDDDLDPEPGSPLERAAQAARLWLIGKVRPEDRSWSALEDAWRAVRRARIRRIKQRWRDRLAGKDRRIGRLERKRR